MWTINSIVDSKMNKSIYSLRLAYNKRDEFFPGLLDSIVATSQQDELNPCKILQNWDL